ncbi:fibrobacter succinogenes major paralogous domain-containing protein [Bacteroidota bacterium]
MRKMNLRTLLFIGITALIAFSFESCNKDKDEEPEEVTDGTITDARDGKSYKTKKIGNQWWMAENLNYDAGVGSWIYDSLALNAPIYGRLYDYWTACAVCPGGWHLPTDDEWFTLVNYLGGANVAGGKLKQAGFTLWLSPNTGATNSSGFSALPGGYLSWVTNYDDFYNLGTKAMFWSSTSNKGNAWYWRVFYDNTSIEHVSYFQECGFSVRCVKN